MSTTTIDTLVSLIIVTVLIASSIVITGQTINIALVSQQNQQTTLASLDILNNLLQNPGNPPNWGQLSINPSGFGLKWPNIVGEMLSPFTLMRLLGTDETYNYNSITYRNLSIGKGLNLFLRGDEYVDYTEASKLLDRTYGFKFIVKPILNISISQIHVNPLRLRVTVYSLSGPLSGAVINSTLFYLKVGGTYPSIFEYSSLSQVSGISGESEIEFPGLNANETKYFALITANLGGLSGISYCTNAEESPLIPIVTNYSSGIISLVPKDVLNKGALNYNLTFIMQVGESEFRSIKIGNPNGIVDQEKTENISLTVGNPGILLISFKNSDGKYGLTAMPWGISSLGLSLKYGSEPNYGNTVVIQTRYVMIDKISYQIELSLWRLYG